MNQPYLEYNLCDQQVIDQLKADGFYDVFMEQMGRIDLSKTPNMLFSAKLGNGTDNVIRFVNYHATSGDSGWTMISIHNPTPAIVADIERMIAKTFTSPVKVLYVDDPGRRN